MRFSDIKINNYVKFNGDLKYKYFKVAQDFLWVDEPLECVLEVRLIDLQNDKIFMACVDDCGTHAKLEFTEEEYDTMCSELGSDVLETSTLSEAMNPIKAEEVVNAYQLTVKDNILIVDKFLDSLG
jgi:hypothetical protein